MKYRVILDVSNDHPALAEEKHPLGMDFTYLVQLAFQEWQGISVVSVERLDPDEEEHEGAAGESSDDGRGVALRERRKRLGVSVHGLSRRSGLDRKTISRAEEDATQTRRSTFEVLHRALNEIEADRAATGTRPPASSRSSKSDDVEFQVSGENGFTMTVRGPSSHTDEIGASVVRLMRDLRDE